MNRCALALALFAVLATGCGKDAAPKTRPNGPGEAQAAVKAVNAVDKPFPGTLQPGDWCRFNAKLVERSGSDWVFHGFKDGHDVCVVRTADDLTALRKDAKVQVVGKYTGLSTAGAGAGKGTGDGMDAMLAKRRFDECWVYPEK